MRKLISTLDRPVYTGVKVIEIPDPDGFPVYEDPITSIRYRCLGFDFSPDALLAWYVFGIISDEDMDPLFFGFVETEDEHKLGEFRRSEILKIATCAMEYDVEWLQDLDPPFYWACQYEKNKTDNKAEHLDWIRVDGPICKHKNPKEDIN